jgi:predicted ester cyclase
LSDTQTAATKPLSRESARALFEHIYELMNERDVRHIPTIFTEDIEFQDDAWPEIMRGHADVERFLTALWRAMPDLRFELLEGPYLGEDGRHAAARVRVSGTVTGPADPPGFAPTDTRLTTEFAAFYELEGERIKRERVILNMNDVGVQMGAAPAPGSRSEKLGVAIQHLTARRMRRRVKT